MIRSSQILEKGAAA